MKESRKQKEQIKMALSKQALKIEPSKDLFNEIKKGILDKESGEIMKNKVIGFKKTKKLVIAVASFVLLGSITIFGVTMGKSWVGHTTNKYTSFPSEEVVLKDTGFVPKYVEMLPGGFKFNNGGMGESVLRDDTGEILTKTKTITFGYENESTKQQLSLNIEQVDEEFFDTEESELVGDLNGIDLYYYQKNYKFVPPNYELTEEDREMKQASELEISYGSSEISVENIQSLSWYDGGLSYSIMGSDHGLDHEEMIALAKVIIEK